MGMVLKVLERAGPRPEDFEKGAVHELEEAYRLRKTAVRASKAGIRAAKKRDARGVSHEKAKIQQCMQKVQALDLVPAWRRAEFIDQVAAELVELVCFEWLYPYVFFGDEIGSPEFLSAKRLEVSPQAWYHGIADVPGELGKAVTRYRRGRLPLKEKVVLRERLLVVIQDIISYLTDATDESVLEITGHEKDFRRRFEGKVARIGALINRLNEEMIELLDRIQLLKEIRQAVSGNPREEKEAGGEDDSS